MTQCFTCRRLAVFWVVTGCIVALSGCRSESESSAAAAAEQPGLTLVVMDPLAAPLSCPCVEGYAQRRYEALSEYLQQQLRVSVSVVFGESLSGALKGSSSSRADVIIGKDSVVRADAKSARLAVTRVASLTDKQGQTTQTGLFVVRSDDPARSLSDLADYRVILGPVDCEEKHAAARKQLAAVGIELPPGRVEISQACSDGACKIVEAGPDVKTAAVISSYANPLLEGCGTIKAGELRVIAETEPVAFISAFIADHVAKEQHKRIEELLLDVGKRPELCAQLESLLGFVKPEPADDSLARKKN